MGLFSQKKQIFVSSVAYNLAGDANDRLNYLKTTVTGKLLRSSKEGMGETLTKSYLRGPGITFRTYGRWARNNGYSAAIGLQTPSFAFREELNETAVAALLPHEAGETVIVQHAEVGPADYTYWVDRFMVQNHPDLLTTEYRSDFDEKTATIGIAFADGTTVSFAVPAYDPAAQYLYVNYSLVSGEVAEPWVEGPIYYVGSEAELPDTEDWTQIDSDNWQRLVNVTTHPNGSLTGKRENLFIHANPDGSYTHRTDAQDVVLQTWKPLQVLIYKQNSGNPAMDALFAAKAVAGSFIPPIPVRIDNNFISNAYLPELYTKTKRGLKKAIDADFDEMVSKVQANPSLGDIDYAFVSFGVSLNVRDNSSRRYVYELFREIMLGDTLSANRYAQWKLDRAEAAASIIRWNEWRAAMDAQGGSPEIILEEPIRIPIPPPPSYTIQVAARNQGINYDMSIGWNGATEITGSGKKKPDAKPGDIWFEYGAIEDTEIFDNTLYVDGTNIAVEAEPLQIDRTRLHWQVDADTWRTIDIQGLLHRNMVYGGKSVDTTAQEALNDPDESPFIIPIHEEVFKRMPLIDATQMATSCAFLVFNCYKVVKQKWYQSGWFKIFLVIVIIVITVWSGGAGAGAIGLLGTNAAVGAAIGFTGTAAIIAGAVANAVAAMILTQIISRVSTALFGDKIGMIVGTIASIVAMQVGTSLAAGSTSIDFSSLMDASNIMKLTVAAGKGYGEYLQANAAETMAKTNEVIQDYSEQSRQLTAQFQQVFGANDIGLDPFATTDISSPFVAETPDSFLSRTLMTGGDIASMTNDMLTNFADINLRTELPT